MKRIQFETFRKVKFPFILLLAVLLSTNSIEASMYGSPPTLHKDIHLTESGIETKEFLITRKKPNQNVSVIFQSTNYSVARTECWIDQTWCTVANFTPSSAENTTYVSTALIPLSVEMWSGLGWHHATCKAVNSQAYPLVSEEESISYLILSDIKFTVEARVDGQIYNDNTVSNKPIEFLISPMDDAIRSYSPGKYGHPGILSRIEYQLSENLYPVSSEWKEAAFNKITVSKESQMNNSTAQAYYVHFRAVQEFVESDGITPYSNAPYKNISWEETYTQKVSIYYNQHLY